MLGSTFSRKNGSSLRWWVSDSHHEERSQRDVLEKRLILIVCILPGFDFGWEILKRKLCFQTFITQRPFWLTKTILALKRVKPSGAARNEWQMPSWDRKEELPYYQMSRSQLKRKSWERLHTFGSFQNKQRKYQGHRHCSSARTIRNKTCSTLHMRTHRGSRSRPDYRLDCSVENKPQMTLLSVCNITSILPPSNSHLTS